MRQAQEAEAVLGASESERYLRRSESFPPNQTVKNTRKQRRDDEASKAMYQMKTLSLPTFFARC